MTIAIVEITPELSLEKSQGFQICLGELCKYVDMISNARMLRRSPEEHADLSLRQLQVAFGIARIAILASVYGRCVHDVKLAKQTWLAVEFN